MTPADEQPSRRLARRVESWILQAPVGGEYDQKRERDDRAQQDTGYEPDASRLAQPGGDAKERARDRQRSLHHRAALVARPPLRQGDLVRAPEPRGMLHKRDVGGGPGEEGCRQDGKVGQEHRSLLSWRLAVLIVIFEANAARQSVQLRRDCAA